MNPTDEPSPRPTLNPTRQPTFPPSSDPTNEPTPYPTGEPTASPLRVTRIWLVDSDTNQDVTSISDGEYFNVPDYLYRHWGLRAETTASVEAVSWWMDSLNVKRDTKEPYSFGFEVDGEYKTMNLVPGRHTIKAEPWDQDRDGNVGIPFTIYLEGPSPPTSNPSPPTPTGEPDIFDKETFAPVSAPEPGAGVYSCGWADKDARAVSSPFSGSPGDRVFLKRSNQLCTLWQVHPERKQVIPVGRSYEGNEWEAYSGRWSNLTFVCNSDSCSITLPNLPELYFYELVAFDYELPRQDEIARFLEQATFGPTRQAITSFPGNFAAWIQEQQALPLTSHRQYFRERATRRSQTPSRRGVTTHPCKRGARYRRYALTELDRRASLEIATADSPGQKVLSLDGEVITVLNASVLSVQKNGNTAPTDLPDGV